VTFNGKNYLNEITRCNPAIKRSEKRAVCDAIAQMILEAFNNIRSLTDLIIPCIDDEPCIQDNLPTLINLG
jgi:hypothetical protein